MRCDWTGSQPVAFRVAAQIFTIRPKLNLIVCCLIFGPIIPRAKNMHRSSPTELHTDRCWKDGHIYWPTISPFSVSTVVLWDGLSHSVKVIFQYILNHFIPAHFALTTPSLWMEITQCSTLRFIQYPQIDTCGRVLEPIFWETNEI